MNPVIHLNNLSKAYRGQRALDNVTLEVPSGVVFALLGENGAGKTTAINIMLGLRDADAGKASVLGLDSRSEGDLIRRRVGYVPEDQSLYDWMSVEEIGWFAAGFHGNGFLPRYKGLADQFDLAPRHKLKDLSKGMKAKVGLSLALASEPPLLVLDEPTSGLDPLVRREFLESMVDVAAAGRTVFLSSHQINEVERVADVVAILREGKLMLVERLDELKASTREVTLTLADGVDDVPSNLGTPLVLDRKGRQCRLLIRDLKEQAVAALRDDNAVTDIDVRAPGLEEIFVAHMRGGATSAAKGGEQS